MHYLSHNEPIIVLVGVEHLPYGDFGTHAVTVFASLTDDFVLRQRK